MKKIFSEKSFKRIPWVAALMVVIAVIAVILASVAQVKSNQADNTVFPDISFEGRYRVDGGEWQSLSDTRHINATGGVVELEGSFLLYDWETGEQLGAAGLGTVISLYLDHVKVTINDTNGNTWESDNENKLYGKGMCSATWEQFTVETQDASDLCITIYNPHSYGNAGAVDSFLKNVRFYDGFNNDGIFSEFEPIALVIAILWAVFLLVLVGAAIFASLLHQKNSREIWLLWLLVFFGGIYFIFSRDNIGILNPLYAANNMIRGSAMMIYVLTAYAIITSFLAGVMKKIAAVATVALGIASVTSMLLSVISPIKLYDTYLFWTVSCICVGLMLLAFIIAVVAGKKNGVRGDISSYVYIPSLAVPVAYGIDAVVAIFGIWQNGLASMLVLFAISVAAAVIIGRVVPQSIRTILNAKSIEAEKQAMELKLQESHISIMLSQIQPHFLYNALNSIYHLCETNPMLAKSMVNSFSEYLRNNLSSLEETGLVPFDTELSHIKTYLEIEKVRFEDTLEIEMDIQCVEFALPVLTVQPIVENAVKHGTSKKRGGGKVTLCTFEDKDNYIIKVSDTGCGFDPAVPKNDGKRHIGIENVRQRLSNMCHGSLTIESEVGVGTVATVRIPKGDKK